MKVLFDSSVLVAALIDSHANHARAFPWLLKAKRGEIEGCIGTHTLAELYAILTSLPVQKNVPSTEVWRLIQDSVLSSFEIVQLTKDDYQFVLESLSQNNIRGGTTYDALIAHAAYKANADKLLTLNQSHFKRVYPTLANIIEEPA
jgi:predicted nucleic acid-binding protein